MGHSSSRIFGSYITKTIGIDTQKFVRKEARDTAYMDHVRCASFTKDLNAPTYKSLGSDIPVEDLKTMIAKYTHLSIGRIRAKAKKERLKKARKDYLNGPHGLLSSNNELEEQGGGRQRSSGRFCIV